MATLNITVLFFAELAELYQSRQRMMTCAADATIPRTVNCPGVGNNIGQM